MAPNNLGQACTKRLLREVAADRGWGRRALTRPSTAYDGGMHVPSPPRSLALRRDDLSEIFVLLPPP